MSTATSKVSQSGLWQIADEEEISAALRLIERNVMARLYDR